MHTFLFTDIAGHTALWEEDPAGMSSALADCERLLETAVSASGGRVVKREGDAVMAVFEDPRAAVAAAASAQSELAQRRWPGVGELRVRIGLHVGAAEHRDGDYYGSTVIRAARLCACAHGGQVVASSAVSVLAPNVSWLDLGEYRLRGLREPERIHQLVLGDERRFPPLRDVEPTIDRLPRPRTSFVGRADEVSAGIELLGSQRIVTLTGAGGSGKTRLAVEIARASLDRFSGGAVFVDLAPLAAVAEAASRVTGGATFVDRAPVGPQFLPHAVAAALGVPEQSGQALEDTLFEHLQGRPSLIVLDNCEHVLDVVAPFVDRLLAACADVTVLATSRERLGVPDERIVRVQPLSLDPDADPGPSDSDAATLFMERARAVDAGFDDDAAEVAHLCARLDGMPLAIELAAARSASLGISGLLAGLDDQLQLLTGGRQGTERHRSLRAVIAWSHDLLDHDERALFRRLAAFVGGFDLSAAVAVAGSDDLRAHVVADVVGRLVDKSLIIRLQTATGDRWRLLESVRAYALERLAESDENDEAWSRHLAWASATAEQLERRIGSEVEWEAEFDAVEDDLRFALASAPSGSDQTDDAAYVLALACGHLTYARHFPAEAQALYEAAADRARDDASAAIALRAAADVAFARMRSDASYPLLLAAADRFEAAGDDGAAAIALAYAVTYAQRFTGEFPEPIAFDEIEVVLRRAHDLAPSGSPLAEASLLTAEAWLSRTPRPLADEALAARAVAATRALDDAVLLSNALDALTTAAMARGAIREAAQYSFERLDLVDRMDHRDPRTGGEITDTYHMAMETAVGIGDLRRARQIAELVARNEVGRTIVFLTTSRMVIPLVFMGEFDAALAEANEMHAAWERAGRPAARWMGPAAYATALVYGLRGATEQYAEWCAYGRHLSQHIPGLGPFVEARVALHQGRLDDARTALADADGIRDFFDPYAIALRAEVAVVAGASDANDLVARAKRRP